VTTTRHFFCLSVKELYIKQLFFVVSLHWRGVSRCVCFNPSVSDIDRGINLLSPSVSDTVKGEEGGRGHLSSWAGGREEHGLVFEGGGGE
jgi:hypothetical protein